MKKSFVDDIDITIARKPSSLRPQLLITAPLQDAKECFLFLKALITSNVRANVAVLNSIMRGICRGCR